MSKLKRKRRYRENRLKSKMTFFHKTTQEPPKVNFYKLPRTFNTWEELKVFVSALSFQPILVPKSFKKISARIIDPKVKELFTTTITDIYNKYQKTIGISKHTKSNKSVSIGAGDSSLFGTQGEISKERVINHSSDVIPRERPKNLLEFEYGLTDT